MESQLLLLELLIFGHMSLLILNENRYSLCCSDVPYLCLFGTGQEYPAIVEFAPFQKIAKRRSKKKDAKIGTIEEGCMS